MDATPPRYGNRPQQSLKEWWKDNHVLHTYKKPEPMQQRSRPSTAMSRPSTAMSRRANGNGAPLPNVTPGNSRPQTAMSRGSQLTHGRSESGSAGISPVLKVSGSRSRGAEAEAIKEAKAASLRFCHPAIKPQFRAVGAMQYIDEFLFRGYEYLNTYIAYQLATSCSLDVDEATVLMTQQALSQFATSYYKLLAEANRNGERGLTGPMEDCMFLQSLYKFADSVLKQKFGSEDAATIHAELARVVPYAEFTLPSSDSFNSRSKESYQQAMLKLGGLIAAQEMHPLAKRVREIVCEHLQCEHCGFFLVDESTGELWEEQHGGVEGAERQPLDTGIVGECAKTIKSVVIAEGAFTDMRYHPSTDTWPGAKQGRLSSILCVPIVKDHACVGVLAAMTCKGTVSFSSDDAIFAQGFADQVSHAVDGALWRHKAATHCRHAGLQAEMAEVSMHSSTVGQLGDGLATLLCERFQAQACSVLMVDHDSWVLRRVGYSDHRGATANDDDDRGPPPIKLDQGICGFAITRPQAEYEKPEAGIIRNNDVSASGVFDKATDNEVGIGPDGSWTTSVKVTSILVVPLRTSDGHSVGVLKLMNKGSPEGFSRQDQLTIQAAQNLACELMVHYSTYEAAIANAAKDREMMDVACSLMQAPTMDALARHIMAVASERLESSDFSLILTEPKVPGVSKDTAYNKLSIVEGSKMKVTHLPTGKEIREAKGKRQNSEGVSDGLGGLAGQVFASGHLHNIREAYKEPLFDPKIDRPEKIDRITNLVVAPIASPEGEVVAVLSAFNKAGDAAFGRLDEQFLRAFGPIAYTALLNVRRHNDALTATSQARALLNGVGGILHATDATGLASHVRDHIPAVLQSERAFLFVLDRDKTSLTMLMEESDMLGNITIPLDDKPTTKIGLIGMCYKTGKPLRLQNPANHEKYHDNVDGAMGYAPRSLLCVPVMWTPPPTSTEAPACFGVLGVVNKVAEPDWYGADDEKLLTEISGYVAMAIKNTQAHESDSLAISVAEAVSEVSTPVLCALTDTAMLAVNKAVRDVVCCDIAQVFCFDETLEEDGDGDVIFPVNVYFQRKTGGSLIDAEGPALGSREGPALGVRSGEGLVGSCLHDRESMIIINCYADDRFDPTKDQKGVVQCINMLCIPIFSRTEGEEDPQLAGVFQMYNKKVGDGFDEFDVRWGEAFAGDVLSVALLNLKEAHRLSG